MDAAKVQEILEDVLDDESKRDEFNSDRVEVLNYLIQIIECGAIESVLDYDEYYG